MKVAYVDTSCLAAITFGERGAAALARRLATYDELLSSNLLEAELRAACAREQVTPDPDLFTWTSWVFPDRPLTREVAQALAVGYLRGADLWHVANALYVADSPGEIAFLTLDERQGAVATSLGFGA